MPEVDSRFEQLFHAELWHIPPGLSSGFGFDLRLLPPARSRGPGSAT